MSGITGQEHAALPEALRKRRRQRPRQSGQHLHLEILDTNSAAHQLDAPLLAEVFDPLSLLRSERGHIEPEVGEIHRGDHPAAFGW